MASTLDPASAFESFPERKERLHKVFSELESKKAFLNKIGAHWKDVEEYLKETENSLRKTLEDYYAKEKALESRIEEAKLALEKKEAEVSEKEQASLARVQEQRDAAVTLLMEQKRKWAEEKQALAPKKEKSFVKDAKLKAANGHGKDSDVQAADVDSKAMDVDTKLAHRDGRGANDSSARPAKDAAPKEAVTPRPELVALCKAMESESLRSFIAEHRKDLNAISAELPFAMRSACDPAQLVLKALDGYYPSEKNTTQGSKDTTMPAIRRACVIMLEALAEVLTDPESFNVSTEIKQSAKEFADLWKSKINLDGELGSNIALDAQSFLQLLATFRLASEYDQDELCKLVTPIARRKQTPALCRSLGLSSKVPDVVDKLIKDGKHIEALSFANAFELLDRFEPVSLLKLHLKEAKKVAQTTLKSGNNAAAARNDANQKELASLRAVLKAIGEYKLEENYPPAPIEKRIAQLEKAKLDRKRSANIGKAEQTKRPRINNGGVIAGNAHEKPLFRGSDRAHYGGVGAPTAYGAATQAGFDRHAYGAGHFPSYGGGNRSPVSLSGSYLYPSDGLGYGSTTTYLNPSSSYSGYGAYGSGLGGAASSYQPYL